MPRALGLCRLLRPKALVDDPLFVPAFGAVMARLAIDAGIFRMPPGVTASDARMHVQMSTCMRMSTASMVLHGSCRHRSLLSSGKAPRPGARKRQGREVSHVGEVVEVAAIVGVGEGFLSLLRGLRHQALVPVLAGVQHVLVGVIIPRRRGRGTLFEFGVAGVMASDRVLKVRH